MSFFDETFAKSVRKGNSKEAMEMAKRHGEWMPKMVLVRTERGRHHDFDFNVYEAELDGIAIEAKTKTTEGEILYTMRVLHKKKETGGDGRRVP